MGGPGFQGPVDAVLLHAVGTNLPAGGPGHEPVPPRPQHPDRDGVRTGKVHRDPEWGGLRKILRHPAQSRRWMGGHRGRGAVGPHQGHQDPALRFSGTERPVQKCPAAHSGRRGRRGIRAGVLRAGRTIGAGERPLHRAGGHCGLPAKAGLYHPDQHFGRSAPLGAGIAGGAPPLRDHRCGLLPGAAGRDPRRHPRRGRVLRAAHVPAGAGRRHGEALRQPPAAAADGAIGQQRVAQSYRHEQMLARYRALYAETAATAQKEKETESEELWLELGSN